LAQALGTAMTAMVPTRSAAMQGLIGTVEVAITIVLQIV
jgi:hypothetical protein